MRTSQNTANRLTKRPTLRRYRSVNGENGAALVEFAMVLPLLFGIIEMSWAFAQLNDVRFGTREGARAAAVDIGDVETVGQAVCDRMDIVAPAQNVNVILTPDVSYAEGSVGALAQVTVTADLQTITGFYDFLLGGKTVSSTVEFRLEQFAGGDGNAAWWDDAISGTTTYACP